MIEQLKTLEGKTVVFKFADGFAVGGQIVGFGDDYVRISKEDTPPIFIAINKIVYFYEQP